MYGRRLTAQQNNERQDNGDKKRLARHHPSDLLRSPTGELIGGGQHDIVSPVLRASPFSNFPCAPREAPDAHVYVLRNPEIAFQSRDCAANLKIP